MFNEIVDVIFRFQWMGTTMLLVQFGGPSAFQYESSLKAGLVII